METVISEVQTTSQKKLAGLDKQRRLVQPYPPLQQKFASLSLDKTGQEELSIRNKATGNNIYYPIFDIFD